MVDKPEQDLGLSIRILVSLSIGMLVAGSPSVAGQTSANRVASEITCSTQLARSGNYAEASRQLELACAWARSARSLIVESKILLWQAILEWDFGEVEKCRRYFNEAREAFIKSDDKCAASFCGLCLRITGLYAQGTEQRVDGDYERATSSYRQAILLGRETGWSGFELKCLRQLGMISWDLNRWSVFRDMNLAALAIARAMGYSHEEGRCLNNIGAFYQKTGLYAQASSHFEKALEKARQVSDRGTEAECLNNLGILSRELGDHGKALRFLSMAHEIDAKLGDLSAMAIDRSNMAAVLLRKGVANRKPEDLRDALEFYRTNLDSGRLGPYQKFVALNNTGVVLIEQGHLAEARALFNQAVEVLGEAGYSQEKGAALNNMATTYLYEGRFEEAHRGYRSVQELIGHDPSSEPLLESYVGLGQCLEGLRDLPGALVCYRTAAEIFDSRVSRISSDYFMIGYARNRFGAYQKMLRILSDQYLEKPSEQLIVEILGIIERAKVKAFLEGLGKSRGSGGIGGPLPGSGSTRVRSLGDGALALEYYIAEDRSYLVTISSRILRLYILPNRTELTRALRGFLKLLPDPEKPLHLSLGANDRVASILIPPSLAIEMSGYDHLIVMPDGILSYLPFEVLRIRSGREASFLIERMSVSYSPSLAVLDMLNGRNATGKDKPVLAIGGIRYSGRKDRTVMNSVSDPPDPFHDLPYSLREISRIKKQLSGDRVRALTGGEVNERTVKEMPLRGYGILHFACHGYVDEIDPLRTALVLTSIPADGEDGFLRTEEIADLDIDADLVVLSSCRSGSGLLENGEGLLSVARPFFFAGARSVLATLWPIYDRSTAAFMDEFYDHLARGQGPSEALRNVKIKMIRTSRLHPCFWAGYVLTGAPAW